MKAGAKGLLALLCAGTAVCATDAPTMRRLTHSQYNHTVRDLLGDQTNPANQFPPEDFVNGFQNQADAQSIRSCSRRHTPLPPKNYRAMRSAADTNRLIPCKPDASCRTKFVRDF